MYISTGGVVSNAVSLVTSYAATAFRGWLVGMIERINLYETPIPHPQFCKAARYSVVCAVSTALCFRLVDSVRPNQHN